MFIILTLLALICVIYCVDIPIINGNFSWLINNHDSIFYGVGLSIIAAYIFYIFQALIPDYIVLSRGRKVIFPKLKSVENKMEWIIKTIVPDFENSSIDRNTVEKQLEKIDLFKEGSNRYYDMREATKIEALYKDCNYVHEKILEILAYKNVDMKIIEIIGNIDESKFGTIIAELYKDGPGKIDMVKDENSIAVGGIRIIDMMYYNKEISEGFVEYVKFYNDLIKINKK